MARKETCILSLTWRFKKYSDLVFALLNRNPGLEWTKMENLDSWPCKNNNKKKIKNLTDIKN